MHESPEDKRRKKISEDKRESESPKSIILPQKKRVLPSSATGSPAKKNQKSSFPSSDESVADENLIRETEAALKNLSGSWPGPRGSSYKRQQEESPAFENLFDEKKANVKLSPSTSSTSSSDNTCSLKDVITLRDQHEEVEEKLESTKGGKLVKIKQESEESNVKTKTSGKTSAEAPASYKPPDFNELVDDSSNELEIDMSEAASDRNETSSDDSKERKKDSADEGKSRFQEEVYHSFSRPPTSSSSPFSSTSAFRPPQTKSSNLVNLGPFPAEATFVGYPETSAAAPSEDKTKNIMPLKSEDPQVEANPCGNVGVKSPEAVNKHYTILQPAPVGSRAASALQEIARDGVPTVSAISSGSSTSSSDSSGKIMNPSAAQGALSPTSMGRGEFALICI